MKPFIVIISYLVQIARVSNFRDFSRYFHNNCWLVFADYRGLELLWSEFAQIMKVSLENTFKMVSKYLNSYY